MTTRRSYQDGCAAAKALDLVGERWALLVVRELLLGPKRFTDLRAGLPTISPNVLTQRLAELEEVGVVHRRKLPPPVSVGVYELTAWGQQLEPVVLSLARWAMQSPEFQRPETLGVDSLVLSLRTMFDPLRARGVSLALEFRFGEDRFEATVDDGRFRIERGAADRPDARLDVEAPTALAYVVHGGAPLQPFLDGGRLRLEGDRAAFEQFVALFPKLNER